MLQKKLEEYIKKLRGSAGLYYRDLVTGEEVFFVTEEDRFESASVIKLPVMVEAFRQMDKGLVAPSSQIVLREEDKVPSGETLHYGEEWDGGRIGEGELFPESGVLNYMHTGLTVSLRELYTLMIVISDNTATNMLIDLLGKENINRTLTELGCTKTRLNRKLFEAPAAGQEPENYISVKEMGTLLTGIYRGELISPGASREMAAVLTNQQVNHKIPFYISHLPVAHKTGEDEGITNDVAIVYGERPFILCLAANRTDVPETERVYQEIARFIYEWGGKR